MSEAIPAPVQAAKADLTGMKGIKGIIPVCCECVKGSLSQRRIIFVTNGREIALAACTIIQNGFRVFALLSPE